MESSSIDGALNDYLGRDVQVTVRSEADEAYDTLKLELHGRLTREGDGYALVGATGNVFGRIDLDASAAELTQWNDPAIDPLGDDWIGFSAGGISITVGIVGS